MVEKLTSQMKETTEIAQVTWDKVKENLAVEKLTSQVKESPVVEKLTSQMKETTEIAQVTWDKVKENLAVEKLTSQVKESPMVEKLTSQMKETAENAQVAWGKVKESPIVEKLTTQMKGSTETAQDAWDKVKEYSTVKNVTAQINESRVWNMAPSSSTLISLGLLPVAASLMFVLLRMLTFHVGTGVVFGLLVSSVTVALPVAGVFAGIYLAATKLSALYNLAEISAEPMQSSEETVPIPSENVESESVESEPMEPELENLMESNDDKIDTEE